MHLHAAAPGEPDQKRSIAGKSVAVAVNSPMSVDADIRCVIGSDEAIAEGLAVTVNKRIDLEVVMDIRAAANFCPFLHVERHVTFKHDRAGEISSGWHIHHAAAVAIAVINGILYGGGVKCDAVADSAEPGNGAVSAAQRARFVIAALNGPEYHHHQNHQRGNECDVNPEVFA